MTKYALLLIIAILSVCLATAGDTIINVWGTLDYGWIDANTFGMRFKGSEQTCQIEQDWPKSILLITNYAHRLKEDLFAWQVRKSRDGEILQVITNDFALMRSYSANSLEPQVGTTAPYSEFESVIPRIFDDNKMFAEGDQIQLRLCWFTEVSIFSFTVPVPPLALPTSNNEPNPQGSGPSSHDQAPEAASPSPPASSTGGEHAPEETEDTPEDKDSDTKAGRSTSMEVPVVQKASSGPDAAATQDEPSDAEGPTQPTESMPSQEENPVMGSHEQPIDNTRAEEPPAPPKEVALQSSYVQGETVHYSFPSPTSTGNHASLTVVKVKAGKELELVYYGDMPYDSATRMFSIELDTTDFSIGSYELVIWITGEMEARRRQFDLVLP